VLFCPDAPVPMYPGPIGTRAGFAWVAVMTFLVVFDSSHLITCAGLLTSAIGALAPGALFSAGTSVPVG